MSEARFFYVRRLPGRLEWWIAYGEPWVPDRVTDWAGVVFACELGAAWQAKSGDEVIAELLSQQASGANLPPDIRPAAVQRAWRL